MGKYKVVRKVITLQFEGHDGLEVKTRSVDTGTALGFMKLSDGARQNSEYIVPLIEAFAAQLKSWNLTTEDDDGNDVEIPATREGLLSLDFSFVFEIIDAWMDAVTGVSGPLETPSASGPSSLVESIPMETLSGSPQI